MTANVDEKYLNIKQKERKKRLKQNISHNMGRTTGAPKHSRSVINRVVALSIIYYKPDIW